MKIRERKTEIVLIVALILLIIPYAITILYALHNAGKRKRFPNTFPIGKSCSPRYTETKKASSKMKGNLKIQKQNHQQIQYLCLIHHISVQKNQFHFEV